MEPNLRAAPEAPERADGVPSAGDHGGDGQRVAEALGLDPAWVLDLSASLNPVAPEPGRVIARHLDALGRYPDANRATTALAEAVGVDRSRVLLTNGGAEAISLLASMIGGQVREPEFSLHPRTGGPLWRSNPHNPTGRLAAATESAAVWDEAFYPLATGSWTRGDECSTVVGSLTKLFACPGLRVGYVIGDPDLIASLSARQAAWAVNGLAAAALPDLLATAELGKWAAAIAQLRAELITLLAAHDLAPHDSDANFVLCGNAAGLRSRLALKGVVVRDCASFGLAGMARVAVPSAAGLQRLAGALEETS